MTLCPPTYSLHMSVVCTLLLLLLCLHRTYRVRVMLYCAIVCFSFCFHSLSIAAFLSVSYFM